MDHAHMREFWNRRAEEDAFFFVDDRRGYRDPSLTSFWLEGERDLDRFLAALELRIDQGDRVLDIGCGVGRLTRVIAGRAGQVIALDISSAMLDRARRHNDHLDNVEWVLGDGATLRPLADGSVDACVSHVVFQHIPAPEITLGYVAEIGRVLRPGGWAGFQVSNDAEVHRSPRGPRARLRRLASVVRLGPRGRDDPAWLGSAVELGELREVAARSGLELERVVGVGTQFCLVRARRHQRLAARSSAILAPRGDR